ncbi:MAG: amidohydrolase family protein [Desulfobacterium sp.]|nr:amidohydrolase family protein [Desulfobacterium sp.]
MLNTPLPALDDMEGKIIPKGLGPVVDAHVHVFPDALFTAVWDWFDQFGWPIRYRLRTVDLVEFLFSRGIDHIVALQYAHQPGMARKLNDYMLDLCRSYPNITGMATVFPGEDHGVNILQDAFDAGLKGVKLHSHVQCFNMNSPAMHDIYSICSQYKKPLIIHAGREPKSPAYLCDPYEICCADFVETVLKGYPDLQLCVPHLGADEFLEYRRMVMRYDNLWLDTTMVLADYLPCDNLPPLSSFRTDRVLYGTDFPNLPYAWDREIKRLCKLGIDGSSLTQILGTNAARLFDIELPQPLVGQELP